MGSLEMAKITITPITPEPEVSADTDVVAQVTLTFDVIIPGKMIKAGSYGDVTTYSAAFAEYMRGFQRHLEDYDGDVGDFFQYDNLARVSGHLNLDADPAVVDLHRRQLHIPTPVFVNDKEI